MDAFLAAQEQIIEYVEQVVRAAPAARCRTASGTRPGLPRPRRQHGRDLPHLLPGHEARGRADVRLHRHRRAGAGAINCARPAMEGAVIGRHPDVPLLRPAVGDRRGLRGPHRDRLRGGDDQQRGQPRRGEHGVDHGDAVDAGRRGQRLREDDAWPPTSCRSEAQASWSPGINCPVMAGLDRRGEPFAASSWTSAAAAAAPARSPTGSTPAASSTRWRRGSPTRRRWRAASPVLQVYRRERRDSGGHGRFRGGVGHGVR